MKRVTRSEVRGTEEKSGEKERSEAELPTTPHFTTLQIQYTPYPNRLNISNNNNNKRAPGKQENRGIVRGWKSPTNTDSRVDGREGQLENRFRTTGSKLRNGNKGTTNKEELGVHHIKRNGYDVIW